MKLAVIVDSKTGNTRQAADWIVQGMNRVGNAEAKAFTIPEVDEDFVKEARGIVIGSPSYAAQMTPEPQTPANGHQRPLAIDSGDTFLMGYRFL